MKIVAVVVTYNRLTLLKRTIPAVLANPGVNTLIVVNNGSTDGTSEWLRTIIPREPRLRVITQENVGGAGGFHTGIREAETMQPDWVWCMDDDVFPRPDCLEQMLAAAAGDHSVGIISPRRLVDGKVFTTEFLSFDFSNPFASTYQGRLSRSKTPVDTPTFISGAAFEGLCIRTEVIHRIGLPRPDLFIFCDDTDYCYRTLLAGFRILYVPAAIMDKQPFFTDDNWAVRNVKKKWKRFYQVRNSSFLNHTYGRNAAVRHLRGFNYVAGYIITAALTAPFSRAWSYSDIPRLWRAYTDGIRHRLGKY
ncbi:MAG: glycosyltransferase [Muribaculaceae bacterium]|nr:glycosyltransferase [Muribaculaceae bacterium]